MKTATNASATTRTPRRIDATAKSGLGPSGSAVQGWGEVYGALLMADFFSRVVLTKIGRGARALFAPIPQTCCGFPADLRRRARLSRLGTSPNRDRARSRCRLAPAEARSRRAARPSDTSGRPHASCRRPEARRTSGARASLRWSRELSWARSSRRGPRSPSAEPRMGLWGTTERDLPDQGSRRRRARTRYGCAYGTSHRRWAAKGGAVRPFLSGRAPTAASVGAVVLAQSDDVARGIDIDPECGRRGREARHRLHRPTEGDDPARASVRAELSHRERESRRRARERRIVRQREVRLRDADRQIAEAVSLEPLRRRPRFGRQLDRRRSVRLRRDRLDLLRDRLLERVQEPDGRGRLGGLDHGFGQDGGSLAAALVPVAHLR